MIGNTANEQSRALPFVQNAGLVGEEVGADLWNKDWLAVFGAIDQMNQIRG